jgi:hypothetical protein
MHFSNSDYASTIFATAFYQKRHPKFPELILMLQEIQEITRKNVMT